MKAQSFFVMVALFLCTTAGFSQGFQYRFGTQLITRYDYAKTNIPGLFLEAKRPMFSDLFGSEGIETGAYISYGKYTDEFIGFDGMRYSDIDENLSFGVLATVHPFDFIEGKDLGNFDLYGKLTFGVNWDLEFGWSVILNERFLGLSVGAQYYLKPFSVFAEFGRHPYTLTQIGVAFGGNR